MVLILLLFFVFSCRRNAILIANTLSVAGACLMFLSKVAKSFELLIVGRFIFGIFCGLVMSLNPLYIQGVSPINLRGAFATLNQVSFASGIFLGMVRDHTYVLFISYSSFKNSLIIIWFSSTENELRLILLFVVDVTGGGLRNSPGHTEVLGVYAVSVPYSGCPSVYNLAFLSREPTLFLHQLWQ